VAIAEGVAVGPAGVEDPSDRTPGVGIKAIYSVGQTIESGYLVVSTFVFFYYTAVLGLSGSLVGVALAISMAVDSIMDPLIGSASDNLRSRFGRRLPLMLIAAPLTGLALWMLFAPPPGLSGVQLFFWLVVSKLALRGFASMFNLPYAALGAELASGHLPRASIFAYRAITGNVAALAITFVGFGMFFAGAGGLQVREHYPSFGLAIGMAMLLAGWLTTGGVWRYARALPQPTTPGAPMLLGLAREVPEVFRNASFRSLFICTVLFWVAAGVNGSLGNHAYTFVWKLRPEQIQFVSYAYYGAILAGVPASRFLLGAFEKKTVLLQGLGLLIASLTVVHALRALGLFTLTGATVLPFLMTSVAVGGLGVALLSVSAPAMMADAADEHEILFGARREGLYFAGLGFASKAATGLGQMAAGFALDALHFPKTAGAGAATVVPEHTLRLLILAWGPFAALFAVGAGLALIPYGVTRARHAVIASGLRDKRAIDVREGRSS
jgi:GPH family glycoside/pentoside/hexuronide:cation symporter